MKIEAMSASKLYDAASKATGLGALSDSTESAGFTEVLETALRDMRTTIQKGEQVAEAAMAGDGDIQSVVEALTATEMALETAVTVRDRVVEAYQEILRMPV